MAAAAAVLSDEETHPVRVHVHVHSAKDLLPKDLNGASDPFVRITLGGAKLHDTPSMRSNLNPVWNDVYVFDLTEVPAEKAPEPVLKLEVLNEYRFGKMIHNMYAGTRIGRGERKTGKRRAPEAARRTTVRKEIDRQKCSVGCISSSKWFFFLLPSGKQAFMGQVTFPLSQVLLDSTFNRERTWYDLQKRKDKGSKVRGSLQLSFEVEGLRNQRVSCYYYF